MLVISLLLVGHCTGGLVPNHVSALLTVVFSLYLQLWKCCSASLQVIFGVSYILCGCSVSMSVGGSELKILGL